MEIRRRRNDQKGVGRVLLEERTGLVRRGEGKEEILLHRIRRLCQKMRDEERKNIKKTAGKSIKIRSKDINRLIPSLLMPNMLKNGLRTKFRSVFEVMKNVSRT